MAFETTNRKGIPINGQWVFSGDFIRLQLAVVDKRTLQKYDQEGLVVLPVFARGKGGKLVRGFFFSEKETRDVLEIAEGIITGMTFEEQTPREVGVRKFPTQFGHVEPSQSVLTHIPSEQPVMRSRGDVLRGG